MFGSCNKLFKLVPFLLFVLFFQIATTVSAYAAITVTDQNPPHLQRGVAYSAVIVSASGGSGSYTFTLASGSNALPTGTFLSTNGTLTGTTCGANGNYVITIQATDSLSATGTGSVQLSVNAAPSGGCAITVSPSSLPSGTQGTSYSQTVSASGGTSPYAYSLSGTLPTGLSLSSSTGVISGTPTAAGTYNFAVNVSDSSSTTKTGTQVYSITIASNLALVSTASSTTKIGSSYSQTNVASGGTSSYTYSISAGALPTGLTINASTGTVSGTPTQAGSFSYTVQVSDGSTTKTQVVTGTISTPTISISPSSLPNGTVGTAYNQTVSASGGTSSYTWSISTGALPTSLSLNTSTGAITGTPTASGTYNFTVQATDSSTGTSAPFSQTKAYSVTIANAALVLTPTASSTTQVGASYSQTNVASGGTGSYTYSISAGTLPAGLTLNTSTGTVSGAPTQAGSFSYTVQVSDGSTTTTQTVSGTISAPTISISPSSLPSGTVGTS